VSDRTAIAIIILTAIAMFAALMWLLPVQSAGI
jgi:hypothetical protein